MEKKSVEYSILNPRKTKKETDFSMMLMFFWFVTPCRPAGLSLCAIKAALEVDIF
jgi:hypothetical protein